MTAQVVFALDIVVSFLTLAAWTTLMVMLEQVHDRRVRWVRLASFGPLHQAYDRLPAVSGSLRGALVVAALLWLAAVLVRCSELRARLFVATAACLAFLTAAAASSP